jgi:hypothetical protein
MVSLARLSATPCAGRTAYRDLTLWCCSNLRARIQGNPLSFPTVLFLAGGELPCGGDRLAPNRSSCQSASMGERGCIVIVRRRALSIGLRKGR